MHAGHVAAIIPTSLMDHSDSRVGAASSTELKGSDGGMERMDYMVSKFTFNPDAKPFVPSNLARSVTSTDGFASTSEMITNRAITKNSSYSGGSGRSSVQQNQQPMPTGAIPQQEMGQIQVIPVPVYHHQQAPFIQQQLIYQQQQPQVAQSSQYQMPPPFPTAYNPQAMSYTVPPGQPILSPPAGEQPQMHQPHAQIIMQTIPPQQMHQVGVMPTPAGMQGATVSMSPQGMQMPNYSNSRPSMTPHESIPPPSAGVSRQNSNIHSGLLQ